MAGEASQRRRTGAASASAAGLEALSHSTAAMATTGPIHIDRKEEAPSFGPSPEGVHSSSRVWVTSMRLAVRRIASRLKNASYGRHASVNPACARWRADERIAEVKC